MDANRSISRAYTAETLCTYCFHPLKDAIKRPSRLLGAIVCAYCLHVAGEPPPEPLDLTQPIRTFVAVNSTLSASVHAFNGFQIRT